VRGTGGGSGVIVAGVGGKGEGAGVAAGGFGCWGRGDCAGSDAEKAKPAIAVNRIGVRRFIVNVGRSAAVEVTPSWRVLRTVYREFIANLR
jgi:hypothetical protein